MGFLSRKGHRTFKRMKHSGLRVTSKPSVSLKTLKKQRKRK